MIKLFLKIFTDIVLIADSKSSFSEKAVYCFKVLIAFAPVAYFLDCINAWFLTNKDFAAGVLVCFFISMGMGVWRHLKFGTFDFEEFFKGNSMMLAVLIVVYVLLEIVRATIGENFGGDIFKITIQVVTLLWPVSTALKNTCFITNGKYPPEFIMNKLYNFEKSGDLKELFNKKEE